MRFKVVMRLISLSCLLLCGFSPSSAEGSIWSTYITQADECIANENYDQAEKLLQSALTESKSGTEPKQVYRTLYRLAFAQLMQSKVDVAEESAKEALRLTEANEGVETAMYACAVETLADVETGKKEFDVAEKDYRKALAVNDRLHSTRGPILIGKLAKLYAAQGKDTEADALFQRAIALPPGALHISEASHIVANDYADFLTKLGRKEEADELRSKYSRYDRLLGPKDQAAFKTLYSDGMNALTAKSNTLAINKLSAALELVPRNSTVQTNLAIAYQHRALELHNAGNLAAAKDDYTKAISLMDGAFYPQSERIPSMLQGLVYLYRDQKNYNMAKVTCEQMLRRLSPGSAAWVAGLKLDREILEKIGDTTDIKKIDQSLATNSTRKRLDGINRYKSHVGYVILTKCRERFQLHIFNPDNPLQVQLKLRVVVAKDGSLSKAAITESSISMNFNVLVWTAVNDVQQTGNFGPPPRECSAPITFDLPFYYTSLRAGPIPGA
jgi:tetratricopeptide (TPR) repeat protein